MTLAARLAVVLRLPVVLVALGVAAAASHGALVDAVIGHDDPHAFVKSLLEGWQALLLHLPRDARQAAVWIAAAVLVPAVPGRARLVAVAAAVGLSALAVGYLPTGIVLLGLVTANLLGATRALPRWAVWLPGIELVLPLPTLASLGWAHRPLARALAALPLAVGWPAADALLGAYHYEQAVSDWPAGREDARVEVLARSAPGARCDWHDVDILPGDAATPPRAVVVAEQACALDAFLLPPLGSDPSARPAPPAPVAHRLPPWWGPQEGLVMDTETDPVTGRTFYLDGPTRVRALTWRDGAWGTAGISAPLPIPQTHTYMRLLPEARELAIVSVNARHPGVSPAVQVLSLDSLQVVRSGRPVDEAGRQLPTARELAWIPPLRRLVLAPDFGDRLYLVDPATLTATGWTRLPAVDGKLRWLPGLGRLGVAVPSERALRLIDPTTGEVDRAIPTQPGVRAFAVDEERGLLLTASVLTGAVLVQRLDGTVVDVYGGLMPMVREIELVPGRPEAVVSTWTRLYRLRYAED